MPYADPNRRRDVTARAVAAHRERAKRAIALLRIVAQADPPIPGDEVREMARAELANPRPPKPRQ